MSQMAVWFNKEKKNALQSLQNNSEKSESRS